MEARAPAAAIIIVNYNSGDCLERCLTALRAQSFSDFEIILVDNQSTDGSDGAALRWPAENAPPLTLIRAGANLGFAAANNLGAARTKARWIATLNPDAYPNPDWLAQLIQATGRHPDAVLFASRLIADGAPDSLDGAGDVYHCTGLVWRGGFGRPVDSAAREGEVFSPCAAAALYRRDAFDAAGGFDSRYFCYIEDIDLGFRLRLAGGHCIFVPDAIARHAGSSTTGRYSAFTLRHTARNLVWTFFKNMPGPLMVALLPFHLGMMALFLVRASLRGQGGPALSGALAGLAGLPDILAARREIQRTRAAPIRKIASAITWSFIAPLKRAPSIRPARLG